MSNSIKCKAAVCWGAGEKLKIEDVEVSPPKIGEVRVKVVASGLVSNLGSKVCIPNVSVLINSQERDDI